MLLSTQITLYCLIEWGRSDVHFLADSSFLLGYCVFFSFLQCLLQHFDILVSLSMTLSYICLHISRHVVLLNQVKYAPFVTRWPYSEGKNHESQAVQVSYSEFKWLLARKFITLRDLCCINIVKYISTSFHDFWLCGSSFKLRSSPSVSRRPRAG